MLQAVRLKKLADRASEKIKKLADSAAQKVAEL